MTTARPWRGDLSARRFWKPSTRISCATPSTRHAGTLPADRLRPHQTAFSEGGLPIGAGLEDLGKGLRSTIGTMYGTVAKGVRYLEMARAT